MTRSEPVDAAVDRETKRLRVQREARRRVDAEERPRQALPPIRGLDALLTEADESRVWRIEGWQPAGGRVLIVGPAKVGKTTFVGGLTRGLVDGTPLLDRAAVTPVDGTVLIVDTEMSQGQLRTWLRDQQIVNADRVVVASLRGRVGTFDLLDVDRRAEWVARLRQLRVRYLIVDCLRPILDACGLDEHREAGRWLVAFDALLREADVTEAAVVHHMGHAAERARGDSRLADWPDATWRLVSNGTDRFISAVGRDVDVPETRLAFNAATRRLLCAGGSRADLALDRTLAAVLATLGASEAAMSGRQVEQALRGDHTQKTVRAALEHARRQGEVVTVKGPRGAQLHRLRLQCVSASECVSSASTRSA